MGLKIKRIFVFILIIFIFITCSTSVFAQENENYTLHTVVYGDTLWKISQKYNVNLAQIITINSLDNTNITVGQKIKIPSKAQFYNYYVKSGDTLWKIANKFYTSISEIMNINNISTNDYLKIGQVITVPFNNSKFDFYSVQYGDSLWKISNKTNTSISNIISLNNIKNTDSIYSGQKLIVANTETVTNTTAKPYITYTTHTVQKGENAWEISIDYKIPQSELLEVNNLTLNSVLQIGQKLKIPVHHVPVTQTPGTEYGEYLDWWTQAQYVFPINSTAKVTDFITGKSFYIRRSYGAFHADCEPLTSSDAQIMYAIYDNKWSWVPRAAIVEVNGRKIAASFTNMPHDIQQIANNDFDGHFDIHFVNSTRHSDGTVNQYHQTQIKIAAGIN